MLVCLGVLPLAAADVNIPQLQANAERGDIPAEMNLAAAYEWGTGVPKDEAKALQWYQKAAQQGNVSGMVRVGTCYEHGKGVEKSVEQALEWYKKASEVAEATHQQNFASGHLLRLSQSGAIKEKYGGIPVEGGLLLVELDDTTPLDVLIRDLILHPEEVETGKAYWIGYNPRMIAVAARKKEAIAPLVDLIKTTNDPHVRRAGLLTLHLIGIGGKVAGRFVEEFTDRATREALWKLLGVEGLTDDVAALLKRDPWPADVPAIMDALARVQGECPQTLNALARYPLPPAKRPINPLRCSGLGDGTVRFTLPEKYTDRDYVRLAIEGIKDAFPDRVEVEEGLLDRISVATIYGNREPTKWAGSLDKLLESITDLRPPFDYVSAGRSIYYYTEGKFDDMDHPVVLHFCSAATARKRLLTWWQDTGRNWYCF